MKLDKINPFIRYAKTHKCFVGRRERSVCYDCRMFYFTLGRGSIEIGDEKTEVCENTLVYLPPRTTYRLDFSKAEAVLIEVLNFDLVDSFSHIYSSLGTAAEGEFDLASSPVYSVPDAFAKPIILSEAQFAKPILEWITEAYLVKSEYYKEICSARLKLLLFDMLTNEKCDGCATDPAFAIEKFIKENYHRHELDNAVIAKAFNYHPYHVGRLIKARTGKTLHEYLLDFRLHIAKNHLTTSALPVTEIAERCGFSSYNYFIRCFRERVGKPPLKYRKEKRNGGL